MIIFVTGTVTKNRGFLNVYNFLQQYLNYAGMKLFKYHYIEQIVTTLLPLT